MTEEEKIERNRSFEDDDPCWKCGSLMFTMDCCSQCGVDFFLRNPGELETYRAQKLAAQE